MNQSSLKIATTVPIQREASNFCISPTVSGSRGAFPSAASRQAQLSCHHLLTTTTLPLPTSVPSDPPHHVRQDDRSRLRINAACFHALLVQLRPASRRAIKRGVSSLVSMVPENQRAGPRRFEIRTAGEIISESWARWDRIKRAALIGIPT
jgi:hypothetical protein